MVVEQQETEEWWQSTVVKKEIKTTTSHMPRPPRRQTSTSTSSKSYWPDIRDANKQEEAEPGEKQGPWRDSKWEDWSPAARGKRSGINERWKEWEKSNRCHLKFVPPQDEEEQDGEKKTGGEAASSEKDAKYEK